jgi:r-opsin
MIRGFVGNMTIVDKVAPDMLFMVDAHWYQFPPLNPLWLNIIAFAIFVIGSVAMIGNYFVLNIFTTTKGLRTPSNMLVINLAFSDFMMVYERWKYLSYYLKITPFFNRFSTLPMAQP